MQQRRAIAIYAALITLFAIVVCRMYGIAHNISYAKQSQAQTIARLPVESARGNFYDCRGEKLTGKKKAYYALCIPGKENYARLFRYVSYAGQTQLYRMRNASSPFLMEVDSDLNASGIYTICREQRYAELPICTHLIGYLNGEGHGVTGLEAALDDLLSGSGQNGAIQCITNAQGALMDQTQPTYQAPLDDGMDVQLTIDSRIQRACEGVAASQMTTGCILVLDAKSAEIRACVSVPDYSPSHVQASIDAGGSALVNRALSAYAVGSVFKPVLAAAALEEKRSDVSLECEGYIQVNDHIYRCAGGVPHGNVTLADALAKSCNCYFITLGQVLGPKRLYRYADAFGFGQPIYLAGGLKAAAGSLPDADALQNAGEKSNFSFGQGTLLASPLQVAAMMNTIASGGEYRLPTVVNRTFDADSTRTDGTVVQQPQARRVISEKNAKTLCTMLAGVVSDGLGKEAQPIEGTAAGKTGTAQTGRYNAKKQEYKNLWFAGFYPADAPQYTIVVLQDDQTQAAYSSAAVFARVCDALNLMGLVSLPESHAENS